MLSPDDLAVIARDPGMPGLPVVLDADRFADVVRTHLARAAGAAAVRSARCTYLRYKPATNCVAGFELETDRGPVDVTAKAYPRPDAPKYRKHAGRPAVPGVLGPGVVGLDDVLVAVEVFPNDTGLEFLPLLTAPDTRAALLRKVLPDRPDLWAAHQRKLAYKAMRRYVAQLAVGGAEPAAVLKLYTADGFVRADHNARAIHSKRVLRRAPLLRRSRSRRAIATEWSPGRSLAGLMTDDVPDHLTRDSLHVVGVALAELHGQRGRGMAEWPVAARAERVRAAAAAVAAVCPHLASRAQRLAAEIADRLTSAGPPEPPRPIHGDFHADQVVLDSADGADAGRVHILDLDEAGRGDPADDLGNFLAHVHSDALHGRLHTDRAVAVAGALLDGYTAERGFLPSGIELHTAAGLMRLAPHPFRRREADWSRLTEALLDRCESILPPRPASVIGPRLTARVEVIDPFNVPNDPPLAFTAGALDPDRMPDLLCRSLSDLSPRQRRIDLRSIRTIRHKPGRRCLIEYRIDLADDTAEGRLPETMAVIGKARAKGADESTSRLAAALAAGGFGTDSPDGVSVPQPLGVLPELHMWFQRKAPGVPATSLIPGPGGVDLVVRIAAALHKLHRAGVSARRRHSMADELRVLRDRLTGLAEAEPRWAGRIGDLLAVCEAVAAALPPPVETGIHRDFYPDQVLVDESDGGRLYLLDLDLYCQGDPALDAGNFIAHLTEQALRTLGDPLALADHERAMEERFVALTGEAARPAVRAYAALTLARHVRISHQIRGRRAFVEPVMALAEERLERVLEELAGASSVRFVPATESG